jgi:PleD family two-component response regulator
LNLSRQITISVGGATVSSTDCAWKDTYRHSDIALYKAKHNGRNRVEIYE